MRSSTKKVVLQALAASVVLGVVGAGLNLSNFTSHADMALAVEPTSIEVDARVRAHEEHGEAAEMLGADGLHDLAAPAPPPPDYERELNRSKRRSISQLDRAAAIRKVEELSERLNNPDLPPVEREAAESELDMVLEEHFASAAGEPEPIMALDDRSSIVAQLDINNVFNKVWGLFQALILAWVPYKLGQRKKQEKKEALLTESVMDRIDEELLKRHRTNKVKQRD
jgi:hypothetical protein